MARLTRMGLYWFVRKTPHKNWKEAVDMASRKFGASKIEIDRQMRGMDFGNEYSDAIGKKGWEKRGESKGWTLWRKKIERR